MRLAVVALALLPVGCAHDWFRKVGPVGITTQEVQTPTPTPASEATAARVHEVGRKLLLASPFAGIEPGFQVVGCKDWLVCHRDQFGVFISDSLADRCGSEDELAGVLASELGAMIAEKRNLMKMGLAEPVVPPPPGEEPPMPMPPPAATVAASDATAHEDKLRGLPTEPKAIAAALLKDAGYPPEAQAAADALLRKANRNRALLTQLAGPAAAPKWSN